MCGLRGLLHAGNRLPSQLVEVDVIAKLRRKCLEAFGSRRTYAGTDAGR